MRSFEIFVAPGAVHPIVDLDYAQSVRPAYARRESKHLARTAITLFLEGGSAGARGLSAASSVLRDLAAALVALTANPRRKEIVRFYDDPWELCVERLGPAASVSVYRAGGEPHVEMYDRAVPFHEVIDATLEAITAKLARESLPRAIESELLHGYESLRHVDREALLSSVAAPLPAPLVVETDPEAAVSLGTSFLMRGGVDTRVEPNVERADLHALLVRGRVCTSVRGRLIDLGEAHPFLVAERFLAIAKGVLEASEHGQAHHVRVEAGGLLLGVRLSLDGRVALTLGTSDRGSERALYTFPALGVTDVVEAALTFGKSLARAIVRRDRAQSANLRLSDFRRQLRETRDALGEARREDAIVNLTPERYRVTEPRSSGALLGTSAAQPRIGGTRLRYAPRWRALVPGIDIRATFLCGDRLVVGAQAETFCLARATGDVLWRVQTERATSVITPAGIARIHPNGLVQLHEFGRGDVTMRTQLEPRLGGPIVGTVVSMQGLPKLLIVTEGERHLVAFDLTSGELRWRFSWGKGRTLRMKRAGRLLYFTSGDGALTALDVLSGSVVWRVRDRLRFRAPPTVHKDALFAVSGGANGVAKVQAVDSCSGEVRWSMPVRGANGMGCFVEGVPLVSDSVVALTIREGGKLRVVAFNRENGELLWDRADASLPASTSWLVLDDLFIGNTPTGELVGIDAASGGVRYRHVLGRSLETDVPRRLEPVLRSGALFVPHVDVHIFRPNDGACLGIISPCEAIPDLLRIDERCDVYIAEESGHVVSFAAGPRLSLVR